MEGKKDMKMSEMKKSEMYKAAQLAVICCDRLPNGDKLEIIRELQEREELELFVEKQAEEKEGEEKENEGA